MTPSDLMIFCTLLFFSLFALLHWLYRSAARKARIRARMNRGLREYLTVEETEDSSESLVTALP
jgi:hypothetical protein